MADIELVIKIDEEAKIAFDNAESNDLKGCYYDHGGVIGNAIKNGIPLPKGHGKLTNHEWIDFLSEQFDISRTSAKEMLHAMMSVKKEDNFKKQFSQGKKGFSQGFSQGKSEVSE